MQGWSYPFEKNWCSDPHTTAAPPVAISMMLDGRDTRYSKSSRIQTTKTPSVVCFFPFTTLDTETVSLMLPQGTSKGDPITHLRNLALVWSYEKKNNSMSTCCCETLISQKKVRNYKKWRWMPHRDKETLLYVTFAICVRRDLAQRFQWQISLFSLCVQHDVMI